MENTISKYTAITAESIEMLNKIVNDGIEKGFVPFGSISSCVMIYPDTHSPKSKVLYSQAMVKY